MKRIFLQPAYVLHTRYYRNTSLLVDFYTRHFGRISAVARGVRVSRNPHRSLLQPFIPLLISWDKRNSDLVSLRKVEPFLGVEQTVLCSSLEGPCLLAGFYVNELMVRLIKPADPSQELFLIYQRVLESLSSTTLFEKNLRIFEKRLLAVLGYGIVFHRDQVGVPIDKDASYFYEPQNGFRRYNGSLRLQGLFSGSSLLSFDKEELCDRRSLQDAKRLMRQIFGLHLGEKPLQSRRLFIK